MMPSHYIASITITHELERIWQRAIVV